MTMSKTNTTQKPLPFAVTRRWKDNPEDFQVLEYFQSIEECQKYIKSQRKSPEYKMEVCAWS